MYCMMTAYRPSPLPLDHVASELALEQDGSDVVELVRSVGGRCVDGELDTKGSCPTRTRSSIDQSKISWIGAIKE